MFGIHTLLTQMVPDDRVLIHPGHPRSGHARAGAGAGGIASRGGRTVAPMIAETK